MWSRGCLENSLARSVHRCLSALLSRIIIRSIGPQLRSTLLIQSIIRVHNYSIKKVTAEFAENAEAFIIQLLTNADEYYKFYGMVNCGQSLN